MMDELARIRARVAEFEQQRRRAIELGNKHKLTPAEVSEELELARIVDSGFTLGTVQTLLATIDAQQAVESKRDAYQRAYAICRDALMAIAAYGNRSLEQYLRDQGYTQAMLDAYKARGEWEYLRAMDYEVAESALNRALDALAALKGAGE